MRITRFAMPALLILSVATLFAGCGDSAAPSADTAETDGAVSAVARQTEQPSEQTPPADAGDDAAPVEGNVISRNLPRFHDAFASDEAYLEWMETFYIHQDFARTPQAIGYYCSSALFQDPASRIPMSDFFGAVLKQSDETVDLCYDELMLEGRVNELLVLGYAMWFANTPHARQVIFRAREIWEDQQLVNMFHLTHTSKVRDSMDRSLSEEPQVVRMLWYEFLATGDVDRLRKVVVHSYMFNAPEGTWQRVAGELARASIVRVLPYDPLVRDIVEGEAANNPLPQIRAHLTGLLKAAGPLRPRPEISPNR